jgi:adenylate kinase family enzyme
MVFGQIVIGPAGSGKTTYCNGMSQFLNLIGRLASQSFKLHLRTGAWISVKNFSIVGIG